MSVPTIAGIPSDVWLGYGKLFVRVQKDVIINGEQSIRDAVRAMQAADLESYLEGGVKFGKIVTVQSVVEAVRSRLLSQIVKWIELIFAQWVEEWLVTIAELTTGGSVRAMIIGPWYKWIFNIGKIAGQTATKAECFAVWLVTELMVYHAEQWLTFWTERKKVEVLLNNVHSAFWVVITNALVGGALPDHPSGRPKGLVDSRNAPGTKRRKNKPPKRRRGKPRRKRA